MEKCPWTYSRLSAASLQKGSFGLISFSSRILLWSKNNYELLLYGVCKSLFNLLCRFDIFSLFCYFQILRGLYGFCLQQKALPQKSHAFSFFFPSSLNVCSADYQAYLMSRHNTGSPARDSRTFYYLSIFKVLAKPQLLLTGRKWMA